MQRSVWPLWDLCDLCETSVWPLWDLFVTSVWSLWDLCVTSVWPLWDLCVTSVWPLWDLCVTSVWPLHTDQEGAEEDEGHKVEVGEVAPALLPRGSREAVTRPVTEARQHDLMPRLARRTPETHTHTHSQELSVWITCATNIFREDGVMGLPEEKSQGLEKGLEVVVVVYRRLFAQPDVPKDLRGGGVTGSDQAQ